MEISKILHDTYEATKHWHLPSFVGLTGFFSVHSNAEFRKNISDFGEAPGDNIFPREILIAFYLVESQGWIYKKG